MKYLLISFFLTIFAQAQILVGFDFDDGNGNPTLNPHAVGANVFSSNYGVGAGLNSVINNNNNSLRESIDAEGNQFGSDRPLSFGGARDTFGFRDMNNANNLSAAINQNDYMTFTVTPDELYALNLSSFSFRSRVNNVNNSAERWALFCSVDGFSAGQELATGRTTTVATYVNNIISLDADRYQNLAGPVTFRLYIYGGNNQNSSATLFDKVILNGSVSIAPQSNILAGYDFDNGNGSASRLSTYVDYKVSATAFNTGSGLNNSISSNSNALAENIDAEGTLFGSSMGFSFGNARNAFGFSDMNNANNLSSAINQNDFMTFTIDARDGHDLNLTHFTFRSRVNNINNSAERWALFSSIDGFTDGQQIEVGRTTVAGRYVNNVIALSDPKFQNLSEPVTFRLYIYGGNNQRGSASLYDKFIVKGTTSLSTDLVGVGNTTLNLPVSEVTEGSYVFENAFGNLTFNAPLKTVSPPGVTDTIYVVERGGRIQRVDTNTNTKSEFLDIDPWLRTQGWFVDATGENGLLSLAFHPNYNQNGFFYVFYSLRPVVNESQGNTVQLHQRVARFQASGTPGNYNAALTAIPSTHQAMITQRDERANHNGGDMHFGPDGYLYISVGDEGASFDSMDNSNHIDKDFFSAILRIDVDNRPGNLTPNAHVQTGSNAYNTAVHSGTYSIPSDNPFIGATSHLDDPVNPNNVRTEIWVTGLRNPYRFSYDPVTGGWFIGDVGQNAREEVNLVFGGEDCGWSRREGFAVQNNGPAGNRYRPANGYSFHDPIHDYTHASGGLRNWSSVTGGRTYYGARFPELYGKYIFADWARNNVWTLEYNETTETWDREELLQEAQIVDFGTDPSNGDILICTTLFTSTDQTIPVQRLVRADNSASLPQTLSSTGAFQDLDTLTPHSGIFEYDVNHPFWSDHALKKRWFSIPDGTSVMNYAESGPWDYPVGTVWIKHFDMEAERSNPATRVKLETRFLVRTQEGAYGLSYRWREDQSDADLVSANGFTEGLEIIEDGVPTIQNWYYPSRIDCMVCHRPETNFSLSFNTAQLNCAGALGENQIDTLYAAGFLDTEPAASETLPWHPDIGDRHASLEARSRAYLDVNCSMCHRNDVNLVPGLFDARSHIPLNTANLINGSLVDDLGNAQNRFLVPGNVNQSVVIKRLIGEETSRMPPIASDLVDEEAIQLITDWINQLAE